MRHALRIAAAAVLIAGLSSPAFAQATTPNGTTTTPTWDLSAAYQTLHSDDNTLPYGLNVDGARNFGPFSAVAELGWNYDREDTGFGDVNLNTINFAGGPRWTGRSKSAVWPFAQVLAGGLWARASGDTLTSSSETHFMVQPGGGVIFVVGDGWGIVGQVDYRRVFVPDAGVNQFRGMVGFRMILD